MQVIRALAGQAIAFADDWGMTTLEKSSCNEVVFSIVVAPYKAVSISSQHDQMQTA